MNNINIRAVDAVWADINNGVVEVEAELPSYLGAFNEITGNLIIGCPPGDCDEWDRISGLEVKGHNGEWYEIIRYITPYGVACNGSIIDLTDFMSALQGKIRFRVYLGTLGNGFLYTLDLNYTPGVPDHPYSSITEVWKQSYNFWQPNRSATCSDPQYRVPIKCRSPLSSNWFRADTAGGDNNTGNAAEFHEDTHHIWVDGNQTFEQHNWYDCNPNPDGCSPQNGTWFFDRAGWCPGAIAQWFDYDMTSYVSNGDVSMRYIFDEDYVDLCNADNPNCVSGATCPNCNDGFNPHLIVSSYLISNGDAPLDGGGLLSSKEKEQLFFSLYPNPATDQVTIEFPASVKDMQVRLFNNMGQVVKSYKEDFATQNSRFNVSDLASGIYSLEIRTKDKVGVEKVIIE